jgi:hypothetical protein
LFLRVDAPVVGTHLDKVCTLHRLVAAKDPIPESAGDAKTRGTRVWAVMHGMPMPAPFQPSVPGPPMVDGVMRDRVAQVAQQHTQCDALGQPAVHEQVEGQKDQHPDEQRTEQGGRADQRAGPRVMGLMPDAKDRELVQNEAMKHILHG